MLKKTRNEVAVGLLLVVSLALLAWLSFRVGSLRGLGERVEVNAVLTDAAGLAQGASVQVAGVEVGRVRSLTVEHDRARVALELRRDAGLRADAIVRVRARSVLGEKYLEIMPQSHTAPTLEGGEELRAGVAQVEVDQLVTQMGTVMNAVDPAAVSALMGALAGSFEEDPERAARMMADLEVVLHNAAVASAEVPALVADARRTLRSVEQTADQLGPVVGRASRTLARVEGATDELPATVGDLRALLAETRGAVGEGRALMSRVEGVTGSMDRVLANLEEIDRWELRRLLREEGILVRLRSSEVMPAD